MAKDGRPPATNQSKSSSNNINGLLLDNFVSLQRAITNLSIKFDSLADQISKLLQLFEISARNFADKYKEGTVQENKEDREFVEKLNEILSQNKVIAKGLTMMEERMRERQSYPQPPQQVMQQMQTPMQRQQQMQPSPRANPQRIQQNPNSPNTIPGRQDRKLPRI